MSDWGVFAVARDIWDHPILGDEPFTRREAWMWLISAAAWKPIKIGVRGTVVSLERGEFCFALTFLARRWRWAKSKCERFLIRLKTADMIVCKNRDGDRDDISIYSINNYNKFQVVGLPKRDDDRDDIGTTSGRHRDKEETFKHSNKEERVIARPGGGFRGWYALYPKKVGKHAAEKAYHAALKRPDATPELLLAGLKLYLASSSCDNPKFIAHPATWLNAGRWLDVPEPVPRKTSLGFTDSPAEEIPDAA